MPVGCLPSPAHRTREREELEHRLYDPELPALVGVGPAEFATTMALEIHPSLIMGHQPAHYADMGVSPLCYPQRDQAALPRSQRTGQYPAHDDR